MSAKIVMLTTLAPLMLQGILKGYDQATNLILDECHERVYSTKVCWNALLKQNTAANITIAFAHRSV